MISFYQDGLLESLSRFKDQFFISETQVVEELKYPDDLPNKVKEAVTIIQDREEITLKAKEFEQMYVSLSSFDCLCMAFAIIDGYCLVTDDKHLITKCKKHSIETKISSDIKEEFIGKLK